MLNRLERKLGKYAINNLMLYIIGGYFIGYLLSFGKAYAHVNLIDFLTLEPYLIIHKFQVWRLISWVLIPPPSSNLIFLVIMCVLYFQLGSALERTWGVFKFNLFIFGGIILTIISAFIIYFILPIELRGSVSIGSMISTYYLCLSIFLAFSTCYPDMQVLLYFIIPIKMKWMALVYGVLVVYDIVNCFRMHNYLFPIVIIASLLNFVLFYFLTRKKTFSSTNTYKRKTTSYTNSNINRTRQTSQGSGITRHKCAVCGRTELTNPEMEFRFCSKCNGNYEYCSEHLFTHQHIK